MPPYRTSPAQHASPGPYGMPFMSMSPSCERASRGPSPWSLPNISSPHSNGRCSSDATFRDDGSHYAFAAIEAGSTTPFDDYAHGRNPYQIDDHPSRQSSHSKSACSNPYATYSQRHDPRAHGKGGYSPNSGRSAHRRPNSGRSAHSSRNGMLGSGRQGQPPRPN